MPALMRRVPKRAPQPRVIERCRDAPGSGGDDFELTDITASSWELTAMFQAAQCGSWRACPGEALKDPNNIVCPDAQAERQFTSKLALERQSDQLNTQVLTASLWGRHAGDVGVPGRGPGSNSRFSG
jgi:hypothetical protein